MSNVRVRIGGLWHEGGVYLTGAPLQPQSERSSAAHPAWTAQQHMRTLTGPDWPAQMPMDLLQRGVTMTLAVTVQLGSAAQMAAELTRWLSSAGHSPWQDDVIIRWTHLDFVGYSEYRVPWAALRVDSIAHAGPQTLQMMISVHGAEMVASAIYDQPQLLAEDGQPLLTEDGWPILLEPGDHVLVLSHPYLLTETGEMLTTENDIPFIIESTQLNAA